MAENNNANRQQAEKVKERVAIFIDGSNFYHSIKKILRDNERVSYEKLISLLIRGRISAGTFYYGANLDQEIDYKKYQKHQKFIRDLRKIPNFRVILSDFKKIRQNNGEFLYLTKGDDIRLAQDILIKAFDNKYDIAIIVSGDEDFLPVIKKIRKRFKKRVGNAYFRYSSSYKLRKACNFYINLNKLISKFVIEKL